MRSILHSQEEDGKLRVLVKRERTRSQRHEAHLPTQQSQAPQQARLSLTDGHARWTARSGGASSQGPQAFDGQRCSMSGFPGVGSSRAQTGFATCCNTAAGDGADTSRYSWRPRKSGPVPLSLCPSDMVMPLRATSRNGDYVSSFAVIASVFHKAWICCSCFKPAVADCQKTKSVPLPPGKIC
jgi:hypothetical protein